MADIPDDPDVRLTRERTAHALTALGYRVATKTLATKATVASAVVVEIPGSAGV